MKLVFLILDWVLFIPLCLSVCYLLMYTFAAYRKRKQGYAESEVFKRGVVLFPAYKEDKVILPAVATILTQDYPHEKFDTIVISDKMQPATNTRLEQMGATVFEVPFAESSKAKAMDYAIQLLGDKEYDFVVILDADNQVEPSFLKHINNAFVGGAKAIQAHRMAKNYDTEMAVLDALSEEINNTVFRLGHVRMGVSSALIGSGMAFDYEWFKGKVGQLITAGEDKELEVMLLQDNIFVDYLDWVRVYDEKTRKQEVFYNQRRRWQTAQFATLGSSLSKLPHAFAVGNWGLVDKLLQWMMLPRLVLLGFIIIFAFFFILVDADWAIKWWMLLFALVITLLYAIPSRLRSRRLWRTFKRLPSLFILMVSNYFRMKGVSKQFIHTEHT